MLRYILLIFAKLEDPNLPLLGPNVFLMKMVGMMLPKEGYKRYVYCFLIGHMLYFVMTSLLDIWMKRHDDVAEMLRTLKHNLVGLTSCLKIITFMLWKKDWLELLDFITKADKESRLSKKEDDKTIVKKYTKYCRRLTQFYMIVILLTIITILIHPFMKYVTMPTYRASVNNGTEYLHQISEHWTPFDRNTISGQAADLLSQIIITIYAGLLVAVFDSNVVVIMVFFCGQFELLAKSCERIFDNDDKGIHYKIKECHSKHMNLIKFSSSFDSCLSPIMFFYTIVSSFTICASFYEITLETDPTQNLLTAYYTFFSIVQLFFYCWHGNEVFLMSQAPLRGMYESGWYKHSTFRKDVILLTGQLDKKINFSAGPFVQLTVASFVNIMKGSYSYFTLINNVAK